MKITKYGHCALLIEENGLRILTDPGNLSPLQKEARNVDLILITHEHPDHFHLESLREVLAENPKAQIITNTAVAKLLRDAALEAELLEHGTKKEFQGVTIEGFGEKHAEIYQEIGQVQNTGYFIGEKLFYPGDALYDPKRTIDVLAVPVGGPWVKVLDFMEYALALKPRVAFPVHDGGLKSFGSAHRVPSLKLPPENIQFAPAEEGIPFEA